MNTMSLAEQFKAWVAEQPPEQTIDHTTYDTCACGAFAHTLPDTEDGKRVYGGDIAESIHCLYGSAACSIIGNGGYASAYGRGLERSPMVDISTYGKLSAWLNSLKPVDIEW